MLIEQSVLTVADNSGARAVKCIKVLGKVPRHPATVGDVICVSVKKSAPLNVSIGSKRRGRKQAKKGTVQLAVVIRVKKQIPRFNGVYVRFDENSAVILERGKTPMGTRIFGPVAKELRLKHYTKVISLSTVAI